MTLRWVPGWNGLTEPEAVSYVAAVEAADGQELEHGVAKAINDFVLGCKNDGIWDAIKASCILAGARTLSGALVPLVGAAPTNNNFVSGDYNRETGLVGDGSTKYLDSNVSDQELIETNHSFCLNISTLPLQTGGLIDLGRGSTGATGIHYTAGTFAIRSANSSLVTITAATGFVGLARSSSLEFVTRVISNQTHVRSSLVLRSGTVNLYRYSEPTQSYSNGRLTFYSIGESIDLALLDSRVSTLMTDIGAAIP